MKKLLLTMLVGLMCLPTFAADGDEFSFTYQEKTLTYTIISESDKTVMTKEGYYYDDGVSEGFYPGNNNIIGELVLPEKVQFNGKEYTLIEIGKYAFYNCNHMGLIYIPNSVSTIGSNAFYGCFGLEFVEISDLEAWCKISFGNSYSNPTFYAKKLYQNFREITEIVIPSSITSLNDYVFYNCSNLTGVTIPKSITSIGYSFAGCSGLKTVNISDLEAWCKISFGGLNSNPTRYARKLYLNGNEITDLIIPNTITSIGDYTFIGCSNLSSVTLHNSITSIGSEAFSLCSGLKTVNISDLEAWCKINFVTHDSNPTYYAKKLYLNGNEITDLVIPNSIKSLGNYAFIRCSGLTSVTLHNALTSIGENAFENCSGIKNITIPNSVTSIGSSVFSGCSGLTNITIPNSVTSIGSSAFYGCSSLTSITIPNSVTSIGSSAFRGCSGLTSITIPNSVTSINGYTFYRCSSLTNITIPNSVTSIGSSAFYNCSSLTSITIPNSVTSIGGSAFSYCSKITSMSIPGSVTSIGNSAFSYCSGLTSFSFEDSMEPISLNPNYDYFNSVTDLYIGRTIVGLRKIFPNITSLTVGGSNTTIENKAFQNYTKLKSLKFNYGLKEIGESAFEGCSGLSGVIVIPSQVERIGNYAFANNNNLTEVAIGCGIKELGESVFDSNISNVYITAIQAPDAYDNSFNNYQADLWLTPGVSDEYQYSVNCWWQFNNLKELIVPTDFKVSRTEISGETGQQFRLGALFTPEDVTLPYIFWHSSDPGVASVDSNGLVTILDDTKGCDIIATNLYAEYNMAVAKVNGGQDGVVEIFNDEDTTIVHPNHIYNLQGVCLKRNASQDDIDALAPGLYIVSGKKILVK